MSYTINPNAKNRWARNAENTMDLSLETDASSVYLDNGRTLEQEIGEGSMVSNVATVDSAMSKVIDGTLDGAYESLMFKGKSLVNIIDYNKRSFNEGNTLNSGVVTINHQGEGYSNTFFLTPDNIKPSTNYFVIFNVISNTYGNSIKLMSDDDRACCFDCNLTIQAKTTGLHKMKVTSKTDLSSCRYLLRTFGYNNTNNGSCQYRVMVIEYIEGMENWDIPFFEGLCDVKMPILRNVGKNLSDGKLETGRYTQAEGEKFTDASAVRTINKIKVKPSTKYCLRTMDGTTIYNISEYHDGAYIGYKASGSNLVFTTSPTTNELHISFKTNNINLQYQLEEGSTATEYEDHKTNILRTSEEIVLREVNGVQDTYNPLTGEYVRRIGEVVLNGNNNESWDVFTGSGGLKYFRIPCPTMVENNREQETPKFLIADKINFGKYRYLYESTSIPEDVVGASTKSSALEVQCIYVYYKNIDVVNTFKQYLQSNPITIQYELAEPITTIVESLTTPFAYQNGHVILESGYEGQSLLPTLEYSTVVNKAGLVENVAKTIQRQEKQLTMLEKMLIQNIINLDYNNTLLTLKNEMEEML